VSQVACAISFADRRFLSIIRPPVRVDQWSERPTAAGSDRVKRTWTGGVGRCDLALPAVAAFLPAATGRARRLPPQRPLRCPDRDAGGEGAAVTHEGMDRRVAICNDSLGIAISVDSAGGDR
jgi:hypothetical protein